MSKLFLCHFRGALQKTRMDAESSLRSTAGFTLAEVMVTLLLVGLLTLAVSAGIGVAVKAYDDIQRVNEAQAVLNNAVTAVNDELRFAYDVDEIDVNDNIGNNGTTAYAFNSTVRGYRLYMGNSTVAAGDPSVITLYAVSAVPNAPAVGVSGATNSALPLVNTAAGTSSGTRFTATLASLEWDSGKHVWTYSITITGGKQPLESGTITVRAVNNW